MTRGKEWRLSSIEIPDFRSWQKMMERSSEASSADMTVGVPAFTMSVSEKTEDGKESESP